MSEHDIYAAALSLQDEFGDRAIDIAAERADKHLCRGEMRAAERWVRIGEAIEHLEARTSYMVH